MKTLKCLKRNVTLFLSIFMMTTFCFARDVTEIKVEKFDSWQEKIDINEKKGKYNILITAKDLGGNTTLGGPFNIWVDPNSDLPVSYITNPAEKLRVPGNLNIVGTCVDDDAVDYVELILDGDTVNPVRATGKEFWSYFLNTENLEEGNHTVEVYGVDINGLKGHSVKHTWILDRNQPVTEVTNIGIGTIVSGTVALSGIISDGNGIAAMSYSLDNGEHFIDTKIATNKKTNTATFKFNIDTKKLTDGPQVVWFKATDNQGSIGYYSFLCFIDNTNPDVNIVYPAEKQEINGTFSIAGSAKDAIGIKSLSWEFNGEKGEFEVVPGNPYWIKEFDLGKNLKNGKLIITAVDTAGNVTKKERQIIVNSELDKPVVSIQWPKAGSSLKDGEFFVRGIASDDDAIASVKVSVDGEEIETVDTRGVFYVPVKDEKFLTYGKHVVTVSATDRYGVVGNEVKTEYFSAGQKAKFEEPVLKGGQDAGKVTFGKIVNPEGGSVFELEASSLSGIKSAIYSIEWSNDRLGLAKDDFVETKDLAIKDSVSKVNFSIPVETLPWGVVHLTFKVIDKFDRVSNYSTCLYVNNLSKVIEKPSEVLEEKLVDENAVINILSVAEQDYKRGMYVVVPSLSKSQNARWNKGKNVADKKPSVGINLEIISELKDLAISYEIFSGTEVGENLCAQGKATVVRPDKLSANGTAVIPLDGLNSGMKTIAITATSGKEYSQVFYAQVAVVREIASEDLNDSRIGQWLSYKDAVYDADTKAFVLGQSAEFAGFANCDSDIKASFLGSYPGLELSVEGRSVIITATQSGVYRDVYVRATDEAGARIDFSPVTLIYDVEGPNYTVARPTVYEWVRNRFILSATAMDATGIDSVEYSIDGGETWKPVGNAARRLTAQLYAEENLSGFDDGLICVDIRAKDVSGNWSYYRTAVHKDTNAPKVTVVVPRAEEVVNGKNTIAFIVKDEGNLEKIEYVNINTGKRYPLENTSMITTFVGTPDQPINGSMRFDFTDSAGNVQTITAWDFVIDNQSDLPIATVQLPIEDEVITKDFVISGVVLDDDGPCRVFYKIDQGRFTEIEGEGYSFSVDVPLNTLLDNEHTVTVYGVDINGVKGPEFVRKFRVSLEEPVGRMTEPKIETTQKKILTMRGTASDKNGIAKVEVSLDNGNSWNLATGKENWSYQFDTRVLPDGTHVVFIRTTDGYEIESIYSSLINIDNTAPEVSLELPLDDSKTVGPVFFSGYTLDNIDLTELYITVTSLDGRVISPRLARTDLVADKIITKTVDLSSLENGRYNVQLTGKDAAGNETSVSRNITLDKRVAEADVNIYYPLNGEHKDGEFNIYGEVITTRKVNSVTLFVDGRAQETIDLDTTGFYKFNMTQEKLSDGKHTYSVRATLEGNMSVESITHSIDYSSVGPWITIDNFNYGEFAVERPFIKGKAGYTISDEEIAAAKAKDASKEQKEILAGKALNYVELSLDNGKTFTRLGNKKNWKYRVENEDMPEGYHFLLVRAVFKNGEIAINRCVVQIDKTAPFVKVIAPGLGGRYNQSLEMSGLASDAVGLKSVTLALRKGDKAGYELPSFIQGLYVDSSFWGATFYSVGAGLSFFDDNVKLQVQYGQFTQAQREIFSQTQLRYGGNVFGLKLIANIAYIPFRAMFGPDFDWLSMGFAVGANFSIFSETASGKSQILSALLAQIEFPRVTFKKSKFFRTIALYSEFQLWFIPSDVSSGKTQIKNKVFQFSEGIRVNIF